MLEQICAEIRNYFIRGVVDIHMGTFTVKDGELQGTDFLQPNQYFRVVGSVFNDGVHQYQSSVLVDEEFHGAIWSMAVPKAVIDLSTEIQKWVNDNKAVLDSPYQSESFGGYSYSKSSGYSGGGGGGGSDWQNHFASRLNPYRKAVIL